MNVGDFQSDFPHTRLAARILKRCAGRVGCCVRSATLLIKRSGSPRVRTCGAAVATGRSHDRRQADGRRGPGLECVVLGDLSDGGVFAIACARGGLPRLALDGAPMCAGMLSPVGRRLVKWCDLARRWNERRMSLGQPNARELDYPLVWRHETRTGFSAVGAHLCGRCPKSR